MNYKNRKTKHNNRKTEVFGILFDSGKEAKRYAELRLLELSGDISGLERQVKYELIPKQNDERACHYIADFVYVENGKTIVEDVKGFRTRDYIIKRKLFKQRYPDCQFREV